MNDRACNSDNEIRTYSRKRLGNKARLRNVWSERNLVALFVSTTKDQKYLSHFLCHTTGMCFPLQISFFIYSLLKVRDDDALWNESPALETECHLISLILMPLHAIPFFPSRSFPSSFSFSLNPFSPNLFLFSLYFFARLEIEHTVWDWPHGLDKYKSRCRNKKRELNPAKQLGFATCIQVQRAERVNPLKRSIISHFL